MLYPTAVEVFIHIHTFLDLLGKGDRHNTGELQLVLFVLMVGLMAPQSSVIQ